MKRTAFVVTFSMKSVLVLAVNERQCQAFAKLRFGKKLFFVVALATDHQINYLKNNSQVYLACLTGGKT